MLQDIGYPQSYEEAEPGIYACMRCGEERIDKEPYSIILNKKEELPECKFCGATYWMKI